jgi:hypothetical protein
LLALLVLVFLRARSSLVSGGPRGAEPQASVQPTA